MVKVSINFYRHHLQATGFLSLTMIQNKAAKYQDVFEKYIPIAFTGVSSQLLLESNVHFKIVKGRKTKWGDFRVRGTEGKPQITVNGDLNPYAFLLTTLHEFAHYHTFVKYGTKVAPHGIEWKLAYRTLIDLILDHPELPKELNASLKKSHYELKASSCTDVDLSRILQAYDQPIHGQVILEKLPKSSKFVLNNKAFEKGNKRRTRYECTEVSTGKVYLVHVLATVIKLDDDEEYL